MSRPGDETPAIDGAHAPSAGAADRPSLPKVDRRRLRGALDATTARAALPVAIGLAIHYALAALIHAVAPTAQPAAPLVWATVATTLAFAGAAVWLWRWPPPCRLATPVGAAFLMVILANITLYYAIHADPDDGLYFVLAGVLAGVFILDWRWLVAVLVTTVASWTLVSCFALPTLDWFVRGVFALAASVVAFVVQHARVRAITAGLAVREEADRQRTEAERALAEVVRVQRSLEAVQRDMRSLIEHNPDGMLVVRDGRVIAANRSFLGFLRQRDPAAAVGRPLAALVHVDHRDDVLAWSVPDERVVGQLECAFLRPDGERVMMEIGPARSIVYQGEPATLLTLRDVTDRHAAIQGRLLIADRMAAVGTLAAGVAHEINNPLAYALGNLTIAQEEVARLERQMPAARFAEISRLLREAHEGGERVRSIVAELKLFSHGDDGRREEVDVTIGLRSAAKMARNEIRHRARLVFDLADVPRVLGNASRLGQVFLNLLVNAAQSIEDGAADANRITVRTRTGREGGVEIEVEDTGCGMPDEVRRRVFEPFFTTKPIGIGTGLGLAYCHNVVTDHGGSITIDTAPGRGTCVRIALPPADGAADTIGATADAPGETAGDGSSGRPAPGAPAGPALGRATRPRRLRILVIDDEKSIRRMLKRVFRNHDVVEAADGGEGLTEIERAPFDVVLCDLMMPRVTGSQVFERTRELRPGQEKRFIFITGGAFTPDAASFLDGTETTVVAKPFDVPALRALVDAFTQP